MATHQGEGLTERESFTTHTPTTSAADSDVSSEWSTSFTPPASDSGNEDQSPATKALSLLHCGVKQKTRMQKLMGVIKLKHTFRCLIFGIKWTNNGFWVGFGGGADVLRRAFL